MVPVPDDTRKDVGLTVIKDGKVVPGAWLQGFLRAFTPKSRIVAKTSMQRQMMPKTSTRLTTAASTKPRVTATLDEPDVGGDGGEPEAQSTEEGGGVHPAIIVGGVALVGVVGVAIVMKMR
jgi:hypothetical protein